ncbi:MAG TPA: hypothetical protein VJS15_10330 [Allosphingosinicella sp.]|nr:hypothetical protein [Allosphingosinicella sp.]
MTEIDLDRLGDVWRQQPDPAAIEELSRSAGKVRRRAKVSQIVDAVGAVVAIMVVLALMILNPRPEFLALGGATMFVLLVSNIRLRKLRQIELRNLTGSAEDMIEQSIERVKKTINYQRLCLFAMMPVLIAGYSAASLLVDHSRGGLLDFIFDSAPAVRVLWVGAGIGAMAGLTLLMAASLRRNRRELGKLCAMRDAYREERESTG